MLDRNIVLLVTKIQKAISEVLRKENVAKRAEHIKSGKLSAGSLGNPTQWQILHTLGVESKEIDDYTLAKFRRGNDVEDFVVETLKKSKMKLVIKKY